MDPAQERRNPQLSSRHPLFVSMAPMTKYHILGGLNYRNFVLVARSSKSGCLQSHASSETEGSILRPLPGCGGGQWILTAWACHCSTPVATWVTCAVLPMSVFTQHCPAFMRTTVCWIRAHLNDLILPSRSLLPNKVIFIGTRLGLQCNFFRDTIQSVRFPGKRLLKVKSQFKDLSIQPLTV